MSDAVNPSESTWFGDSTLEERFPAWTSGNAAAASW